MLNRMIISAFIFFTLSGISFYVAAENWYENNRIHYHVRFSPENDNESIHRDLLKFVTRNPQIHVLTRHVKTTDDFMLYKNTVGGVGQLQNDLVVDELVDRLKLITYYWHASDATFFEKYPEFRCKSKAGKILSHRKKRGPYLDITGLYAAHIGEQFEKLVRDGVSGIYLDGAHVPRRGCYSEISVNEYSKKTDQGASFDQFQSQRLWSAFTKIGSDIGGIDRDSVLIVSATSTPSLNEPISRLDIFPFNSAVKTEYGLLRRFYEKFIQPKLDVPQIAYESFILDYYSTKTKYSPHVWVQYNEISSIGRLVAQGMVANVNLPDSKVLLEPDSVSYDIAPLEKIAEFYQSSVVLDKDGYDALVIFNTGDNISTTMAIKVYEFLARKGARVGVLSNNVVVPNVGSTYHPKIIEKLDGIEQVLSVTSTGIKHFSSIRNYMLSLSQEIDSAEFQFKDLDNHADIDLPVSFDLESPNVFGRLSKRSYGYLLSFWRDKGDAGSENEIIISSEASINKIVKYSLDNEIEICDSECNNKAVSMTGEFMLLKLFQ